MANKLLPLGLYDTIMPKAEQQAVVRNFLQEWFSSNGYERVDVPLLEFEDTLFSGPGQHLKHQTFRVMDPLSKKMMGIRSDITAQVARLVASRLTQHTTPIRLSYEGDVLHVDSQAYYGQRQSIQAGIELIGVDHAKADAEIIIMTVLVLQHLGLEEICVDFTIPKFTSILMDEFGVPAANRAMLIQALERKDMRSIIEYAGKHVKIFSLLVKSGLTVAELLKEKLPKGLTEQCERLQTVQELVRAHCIDVRISMDVTEYSKFRYQSGIGFTVFSSAAPHELARGGRYKVPVFSNNKNDEIDAVGMSLYVNEVFANTPPLDPPQRVLIPFDIALDDLVDLQGQGYVVVRSFGSKKTWLTEAKKQRCDFVFDQGLVSI